MGEIPNQKLLEEVNEANSWVRARKTKPVWARQVHEDETVETLEGTEMVKAGDYLCRGIADELWPQTADRLADKYEATEEVDGDGWRKYDPKPDAEGVLAAQIEHEFSVTAEWGTLNGKAGDFLVKDFSDRHVDYPIDVWIVDAKLFKATYEFMGVV